MSKKALLAAAFCAAAIAGGPSAAFAGEGKGPPSATPGNGTPPATANQGQDTGAPAHANSICAFSGLNDGNPPFAFAPVQSYGQDVVLGLDVPNPGEACQGFSNPDNPGEHP